MRSKRWKCALVSAMIALLSIIALAKEHGHGRDDDDGWRKHRYSRHDRKVIRGWRHEYRGDLPPGLARRDELPPGLERQLMVRGTLPPGLRDRIRPCPESLEHRLPPPPPECRHVLIGGHIVLMNRRTFMVLDIFHFER